VAEGYATMTAPGVYRLAVGGRVSEAGFDPDDGVRDNDDLPLT
jgi:hypothetical protein